MTQPTRDPLTGVDRVLIDGTNLLHAMSRQSGQAPASALVGRLRAVIPASIGIEVVFDGAPERGMRGERIASGVTVRHSGQSTADDLMVRLVEGDAGAVGSPRTVLSLVVTDDRDLRARLHARGARTAGAQWLLERLDRKRLSSPSTGNRRAPVPPTQPEVDPDDERDRWRPGRGATRKRGPSRRHRPPSGRMPA